MHIKRLVEGLVVLRLTASSGGSLPSSSTGIRSISRSVVATIPPRMAGKIHGVEWHDLKVPAEELRPNLTLSMGQCFNWNKLCDGIWVGSVGGRALAIQQTAETTLFASLTPLEGAAGGVASLEAELRDYFQLSHGLADCYTAWAAADPRMKIVLSHLPGVRVVRQCPWECLVSFICSSNNNIKRIALMLDKIRSTYGEFRCSVVGSEEGGWRVVYDMPPKAVIETSSSTSSSSSSSSTSLSPSMATPAKKRKGAEAADGDEEDGDEEQVGDDELPSTEAAGKPLHFFSFPTAQTLAAVTEEDLRKLGTGYRAKFIKNSAATLEELGGLPWLLALRKGRPETPDAVPEVAPEIEGEAEDEAAAKKPKKSPKGGKAKAKANVVLCDRLWVQDQLQRFPGVGRKVADCVAVFSLDQAEAVPVDTHVWAIAVRDYNPGLKEHQSLTPSVYELIGDEFRNRFTLAGWAHSVLFAAELPEFRRLLPELLQGEMKAFAEQRGQDKRDKKEALSAKKAEKASSVGPSSGSGKKKAKMLAIEEDLK